MDWSLAIIIWIICGIASFLIAQAKGAANAGTYFLLGVLLGPLGILAAAIGARPPAGAPANPSSPAASGAVPAPARPLSVADELEKLIRLREAGELSPAEFARARLNVLGGGQAPAASPSWRTASQPAALVAQVAPTPAAPAGPAGPAWTEGTKQSSRSTLIAVLLIAVIGLGAVAFVMYQGQGSGASVSSADLPPTGMIWFGDSYDPGTFELTNRGNQVDENQAVALVAALRRPSNGEYLTVNISDSTGSLPLGGGDMSSGNDVMAYLIPGGILPAGTFEITITDAGGNKLAQATLYVR